MALGRRYSIWGQRASRPRPRKPLSASRRPRRCARSGMTSSLAARPRPRITRSSGKRRRYSAAGTGGSTTSPTALDPGDPTNPTSTSVQNNSTDPTYTSNTILFYVALNQRATHRWIADPNGPMITPATANNGIGMWATNASFTGNINMTLHFGE